MKDFIRIIKLAKPFRGTFIFLAVLICVIAVSKQVAPWVSERIINQVQLVLNDQTPIESGTKIIVTFAIVYLVSLLVSTLANRFSWHHSQHLTVKLEKYYKSLGYKKLLNHDISYFDNQTSGSLMSKLDRGVNRIVGQMTNINTMFLPNILAAIIALVVVIRIKPEIALIMLATTIPYILINLSILKKAIPLEEKWNKLFDDNYGHFWEVISSIRLVKSFTQSDHEHNKMETFYNKIVKISKRVEKIWDWSVAKDIILELMTWGIYIYSISLVLREDMSLGVFVLIIQYMGILKEPLWNVTWMYFELRKGLIGAKDYFKIIDSTPRIADPEVPEKVDNIKGKIEFKNVTFAYPTKKESQLVLKGINFSVNPGETIALVAKSGGGKTTIANLVNRFYDVTSGQISLDGIDVKNLRQSDLRKYIGIVLQESYLFELTIEENLRYGNPEATTDELIAACKMANAWDFIQKLPLGLKTKIGERGIKLSGGQKQRLSIARTLLKDPPILILDEATSSLDSESEQKVQEAIWRLVKGRSTIIIAHRLSTIQRADRILVIDEGKILEEGSHLALLRKQGIYSGLYDIQQGKQKRKEYEIQ